MRTNIIFILSALFIINSCQSEVTMFNRLVGKWKMYKIIQDGNDVTDEHNPNDERTVIFMDDSTFVSDGRPYGKNTGRWSFDENTFELFLDSDAGEGDDSYWIVEFENEDRMLWRGARSDFTKRFNIIHNRFTAGNSNNSIGESGLFNMHEPVVRVQIITMLDSLRINCIDNWGTSRINDSVAVDFSNGESLVITAGSDGIKVHNISSGNIQMSDSLVLISADASGELEIEDVPYGTGWWWEGSENRIYEGEIYIYPGDNNKPQVIVKLPLEDYLYGVVPYEIGSDSPEEALKAQAVAARSEAVTALLSGMYNGPRHDLTSDVECQVFSGNKKRSPASDEAVNATRGKIISEKGKPINAYYASNCGGHSELIGNVWPERPDPESYRTGSSDAEDREIFDISSEVRARRWIEADPDVFCNPNIHTELPEWSRNNFRWRREYTVDEISSMIAGDNNFGKLTTIFPLKRGASGRIYHTRLVFENHTSEVIGELTIRQLFKPALRSACFVVDKQEDKFILRGAGWGHGVGMCQSGAVAQAILGKDFVSILSHYYPEADIITLY